jgi:SH3 domain protein
MALEILDVDEESGFTQIRTNGGLEGWLPTQYLVPEPIARDQLRSANSRISELENTIRQQRNELTNLAAGKGSADQSNVDLNRQVVDLQREVDEIKRISKGAIEEHAENERLTGLNARLRGELDDVSQDRQRLEDNLQQRWLLVGAGLVLAGLLIGIIIKARPRRSAWT